MAPKPPNVSERPGTPLLALLHERAAGERWEDGQDVVGPQTVVRAAVTPIEERDALEVGGDTEAADDVADGAALGDLDDGHPITTVGWQERDQGGEESDLDPHLNPPCPS